MLSALFLLLTLNLAAQVPLTFVENKGQWEESVRFRADVGTGAFYVHEAGFTVLQNNTEDMARLHSMTHGREASEKQMAGQVLRSHIYRVDFVGARPGALLPDKTEPGISNYFIGNDRSRWASGCRTFGGITVRDLYPNIDLRYYSENGQLKYDLIVHPGGDPSKISLRYTGADGLSVREKSLEVKTSVGTVRELPPYAYQVTDQGRQEIGCQYRVKDSILRFDIKNYDSKNVLVIDPTIVFVSLTGSTTDNWGFTATYGPDGSFFSGGIVFGPGGFLVSPGAYQTSFGKGVYDIGIMRLNAAGNQRIYATYIGGSANEQPHSLFADRSGNLVIAGRTDSPLPGEQGAFPVTKKEGPLGNSDIVIMRLDPTGSQLLSSVRIGGSGDDGVNISTVRTRTSLQYNYGDDGRSEVILDGAGNVYVASCTRSSDFPKNNALQNALGGAQDAVVIKLNAAMTTVLASGYLGGGGDDAAYVLSLSPATGNVFVAGGTASTDFFGVKPGSLFPAHNGQIDGFITELTNDCGTVVHGTYIGTDNIDQVYGIQFDRSGFPYVMGQTLGNWPVVNAPWSIPNSRQFIAKLQPDLSGWVYSTCFGTAGAGRPNISPTALLVDRCENVYVSGWGGSVTSPFPNAGTIGLPVTPDAVNSPPYNSPTQTDGSDFYFFVLKRNATGQLFGSFFGENNPGIADHVDGGTSRFDANGVIYQAVCANCGSQRPKPQWPTTTGAWSELNGTNSPTGGGCNLGMIKIAFNLAGLSSGVQSAIGGVPRDTAGCLPLTVEFRDSIGNAVSWEWDLTGDGVTDLTTTTPNASFTYNAVGTYRVRLIAVDPNSCNIRDTSFVNIRVGSLEAKPDFSFRKLNPCDSLKYEFTVTTPDPPQRPFRNNSFIWEFPDDNTTIVAGPGTISKSFPRPGSYRVRLRLVDTAYCNAPDVKDTIVNVAVLVKAGFTTPPRGCVPYRPAFVNTSQGGQTFSWNFGNGQTSNDPTPTNAEYTTPGRYTIRLVVVDSGTCNIIDSTSFEIVVDDKPRAGIGNVNPQPPTVNTPITFENTSQDAIRYLWLWGDGEQLATNNQLPVSHEYNTTDSFLVKLVAYNTAGCPDTAARWIRTLVEPAIDVPNAFVPLSGGVNGTVYARGFGIATLHFTIWNRWGQKVFETTDRKTGWDGTVKGQLQPMDVYAYTLEVTFVDGRKATKKGDITLIR
ncbi:MAG: PKD domain-containing protein [Chitinophagaceae bacterium]|nr:MAG: PKD domain-containing protein [Chitinophagaceae bacterium]